MAEPPTLEGLVKEVGIPLALLDQKCSDEHLKSISLFLDWRMVAPHLGLNKTDIDEIKSKETESEKRLETLQKWKMKFGYLAKFKTLVQVLLKVGNADHAELVCRLLQPQGHTGDSSGPGAATTSVTPTDQSPGSSLTTTEPAKQPPSTATTPIDQSQDRPLASMEPTKVLPSTCTVSDQSPGSPLATTEPTRQLPSTTAARPHDTPVATAEPTKPPPGTTVEVANITAKLPEQTIETEIRELEDQFFNVVYKAAQDLETVDLLKVKLCITQLPVSLKHEHIKLLQENLTAINNAKNVTEIFSILGLYWDFLNCGLLNEIVHKLGNTDTKQLMEEYAEKLREFRVKTRLGDYIGKWARSCPPHFSEFVSQMGGDWRDRTLEDLENFRIELAGRLYLEEYALHSTNIKPGSISVTWAIPSSLPRIADTLQAIFPLLKKEYDVLTVVFQGKHIPEVSELAPLERQTTPRKRQSDSTKSTIPYEDCCCCLSIRRDGGLQDAGSGVIIKFTATPAELMSCLPGLKLAVDKYGPLQTSYVLITCHHIIPAMSDLKGLYLDLGLGEEYIHRLESLAYGTVSCCGKDGVISSGPDPQDDQSKLFSPHENSTSANPCYFKLDFTMLFLNKNFEETILSKIAVPELSLDTPKPWLRQQQGPDSLPDTQLELQLYQRVGQETTVVLLQPEVQKEMDAHSSPHRQLKDEIEMNKMLQRIHYTCTPECDGMIKEGFSGSPVVHHDPVNDKAHLVGIHVGGAHDTSGYYGVTMYEIIQLLKGKPAAFFALMAPELPLARRMSPARWAHLLIHNLGGHGRQENRPSYSYLVEVLHLLLREVKGVQLIGPRIADASKLIVEPALRLLATLFKCFEDSGYEEIKTAISGVFAGDELEDAFRTSLRKLSEFVVADLESAISRGNVQLLNTLLECHNIMLNFKDKDVIALLSRDDVVDRLKLCLQKKYESLDIERNIKDILAKCHRMKKDAVLNELLQKYTVSSEELDAPFTDTHIQMISKFLEPRRVIASLLEVDQEVESDGASTARMRMLDALKKWKDRFGSKATYRKLIIDAVLELGREYAANLLQILISDRDSSQKESQSVHGGTVQSVSENQQLKEETQLQDQGLRSENKELREQLEVAGRKIDLLQQLIAYKERRQNECEMYFQKNHQTVISAFEQLHSKVRSIIQRSTPSTPMGLPTETEPHIIGIESMARDARDSESMARDLLSSDIHFLDFHLLQDFVEEHGDEDLKSEMKEYCAMLETFRKATAIKLYIESEGHVRRNSRRPPPDFMELTVCVVDRAWESATLEDMEQARIIVAKEMSLSPATLLFITAEEGTVKMKFWLKTRAGHSIQDILLDLQSMRCVVRNGVVEVHINGNVYEATAADAFRLTLEQPRLESGNGGILEFLCSCFHRTGRREHSSATYTVLQQQEHRGEQNSSAEDDSTSFHCGRYHYLDDGDTADIITYLLKVDSNIIQNLGIVLGILPYRLHTTNAGHMVGLWLLRVDNVSEKCRATGGLTWETLERAMRHTTVGLTGIADMIRKDKLI